MATIRLRNGSTVIVPDDVAESYTSRGRADRKAPVPAEQDLDTMTIADLRQHAKTHGIDLGTARLKADIRNLIDNATE